MPSAWFTCEVETSSCQRRASSRRGRRRAPDDRTDELKRLDRSIFRPVITFNKDAKRAAQEAKVLQRYEEEREKAMADIRETQNRLGQASTYGSREEEIGARPNGRRAAQPSLQKEQRKYYQFEATASDDEPEDELDDNLDEISGQKTVNLDNRVFKNTEKVHHSMH
ncbi:hypothetical protein EDB92DRAFT_2054021 [Lactarius akahatsu]|uniref:Uncharacterized protein n=1 Tax=Lactarius akahatsu TaxID=416441 RepID=A0AAD4LFG7_9AGAM|nr:hypothetical protein EDB92DRAFT_2054021 [Lactarius akahatsu]